MPPYSKTSGLRVLGTLNMKADTAWSFEFRLMDSIRKPMILYGVKDHSAEQ